MRILREVAGRFHQSHAVFSPKKAQEKVRKPTLDAAELNPDILLRPPPPKRRLLNLRLSQQPKNYRPLSQPKLLDLITRNGSPPHTAWLDAKYRLFTTPGIDGAVGYVKHFKCAVVFGEPLSAPAQQEKLTYAFESFCKRKHLSPLYCATRTDFAHKTAARGGGYIEFGAEDILVPSENKTSSGLRSSINKAKKAGVQVQEYRRPKGGDTAFEARCESLVDAWLKGRAGIQMFGCRVQPFAGGDNARWLYAQHNDKVVGFITLTQLNAQHGFSIEHCIVEPGAPSGTSEWLIDASVNMLQQRGIRYESFGIAATPELGDIKGLSPKAVKITHALYKRVDGFMKFSGKVNFHKKFGVKRREPLFVAFPKSLGPREMSAVVLSMGSGMEIS